MAHRQLDARALRRIHDGPGVLQAVRDGFFAVDVLARRGQGFDVLLVVVVGRREDDGLDLIVAQERIQALRLARAVALHEGAALLRRAAEARDEPYFTSAECCVREHVCPAPQPHRGDAHGFERHVVSP